ncbi:MAG: inositol monophosphatase [Chloroflexi bacterium]|nr:inositol monophosphatase [Chloroflexota bacterium]
MTFLPMRELAERLAKTAGGLLMGYFGKELPLVRLRSTAKEAVTAYDKMADDLIVRGIRKAYPEHSVLTEESGLLSGNPDWLWIVDSLDGTGNFANWNPLFSVCIALMHKNELVVGTVYAPAINEFYIAEKGRGAFINGRRMRVSEVPEISRGYLLYCEGGSKDRVRTGWLLNRVYPEVVDIRKLGSAGLETAWVAAEKAEAYFTTSIEPWDVAAGVLLVTEAGGQVSDFQGSGWKPEKSDLLFSNRLVHAAILDLLKS